MVDAQAGDAFRCPLCGKSAWFRDPIAIVVDAEGHIVVESVYPEATVGGGWSCMECGEELPRWLPLARRLDALAQARQPRR